MTTTNKQTKIIGKSANDALIDQCKESNFEAMAVTVDTAVGGNREWDLYSGFRI